MILLNKDTSELLLESNNNNDELFVLDSSAIYNGILAHIQNGIKFIPDCVLDEVRGMLRGEAIIAETLLHRDLKIIKPEKSLIEKVKMYAYKTGDVEELSNCDLSVLAVALFFINQKKSAIILTDDYDIQNLAHYMGIPSKGIHWHGITAIHKYSWICPACGMVSKEKISNCTECGTKMQREIEKKRIKKRG